MGSHPVDFTGASSASVRCLRGGFGPAPPLVVLEARGLRLELVPGTGQVARRGTLEKCLTIVDITRTPPLNDTLLQANFGQGHCTIIANLF